MSEMSFSFNFDSEKTESLPAFDYLFSNFIHTERIKHYEYSI